MTNASLYKRLSPLKSSGSAISILDRLAPLGTAEVTPPPTSVHRQLRTSDPPTLHIITEKATPLPSHARFYSLSSHLTCMACFLEETCAQLALPHSAGWRGPRLGRLGSRGHRDGRCSSPQPFNLDGRCHCARPGGRGCPR